MSELTTGQVRQGVIGRMPLGRKVVLALGTLLALLTLTILLAVVLVGRLASTETRINDRNIPLAESIDAAALAGKGVANDERGFLMSGDRRYVGEAEARVVQARTAFAAALQAASSREERRVLADASDSFETWVTRVQDEFATYPKDKAAAVQASLGETRDVRKTYEADLTRAQSLAASSLAGAQASVAGSASSSRDLLLACLLAVLAAGLVVAWWMVRLVAAPVQRLLTLVSELPVRAGEAGAAPTGSASPSDRGFMTYGDAVRAEAERRRLATKVAALLEADAALPQPAGEATDSERGVVVSLADETIEQVMATVSRHHGAVVIATQLPDGADPRLPDGVAFTLATPAGDADELRNPLVNPLGPAAKMAALWQLVSLDRSVDLVVRDAHGRAYTLTPLPRP